MLLPSFGSVSYCMLHPNPVTQEDSGGDQVYRPMIPPRIQAFEPKQSSVAARSFPAAQAVTVEVVARNQGPSM